MSCILGEKLLCDKINITINITKIIFSKAIIILCMLCFLENCVL